MRGIYITLSELHFSDRRLLLGEKIRHSSGLFWSRNLNCTTGSFCFAYMTMPVRRDSGTDQRHTGDRRANNSDDDLEKRRPSFTP